MSPLVRTSWLMFILVSCVSVAFAGEGEEEFPAWFPMLELGGVVLGVVVCALVVKIYVGMRGGMIGDGFGRILYGVVAITMGIASNGINEMIGVLGEFGAELTFELFIYAGLIFIGAGVSKVAEVAG